MAVDVVGFRPGVTHRSDHALVSSFQTILLFSATEYRFKFCLPSWSVELILCWIARRLDWPVGFGCLKDSGGASHGERGARIVRVAGKLPARRDCVSF